MLNSFQGIGERISTFLLILNCLEVDWLLKGRPATQNSMEDYKVRVQRKPNLQISSKWEGLGLEKVHIVANIKTPVLM